MFLYWVFLHGEIVSKGSHYFPGKKNRSSKILLKIHRTNTKL